MPGSEPSKLPFENLSGGRVLGYTPRDPEPIHTARPSKGVEISSLHSALLDDEALVISDLHLGLEGVLHMQGVAVPRFQRGIMVPRIEALLRHYNPQRLIVNGDFKHNFSRNLDQEWREARQMLQMLRDRTAVTLVKGNHDNYLDTMGQAAGVPVQPRVDLERFALAHGHEDFDAQGRIAVVGHEHPSLVLRDAVGGRVQLPCFLASDEVLALPAFSPLSSGTDITSSITGSGQHFTPIFERVDTSRLRVWGVGEGELLDFRTLGELRGLGASI
ncbi:MAG TPA: metallophosphoesterase [Candidatus Thermoplasmatota archaeon]|nr:metallophosphoesterase [Candidatus Thermoplasmatota archaeon]